MNTFNDGEVTLGSLKEKILAFALEQAILVIALGGKVGEYRQRVIP